MRTARAVRVEEWRQEYPGIDEGEDTYTIEDVNEAFAPLFKHRVLKWISEDTLVMPSRYAVSSSVTYQGSLTGKVWYAGIIGSYVYAYAYVV